MKVLYLDKLKPFQSNDTQENVKELIKKYGTKFTLTYKKNSIPIVIKKHYYYEKFPYYSIQAVEELKAPVALYSFKLNTSIMTNKGIPDYTTAEIDNIQRNPDLGIESGTFAVELALKLLTLLNFNAVILTDASSIICPFTGEYYSLALYKLLERGMTFYEKFGFTPYYSPNLDQPYFRMLYQSEKDVVEDYRRKINYMRNYSTKKLLNKLNQLKRLMLNIIREDKYNDVEIKIIEFNNHFEKMLIEYPEENNRDMIFNKLKDITEIIAILDTTKKTTLGKDLLSLDCATYKYVLNFLTDTQNIHTIKLKKKVITLDELSPMIFLNLIRRDIIYRKKLK